MQSATNSEASGNAGSGVLTSIVAALDKINPITKWLFYIAGGALFFYVCFMFTDVVLRYFFGKPLHYSIDIGGAVLTCLCFMGVAYVQVKKKHLVIDILINRLTEKAALTLSTAMYVISLAVIALMAWRGITTTAYAARVGMLSYSGIPTAYTSAIIPLGCIFLFIVFLRDILDKINQGIKYKFGIFRWLLGIVLPILLVIFVWYWVQPMMKADLLMVGIICIALTLLLAFLGMPLGFVLFLISFVLMGSATGIKGAYQVVGQFVLNHATNYTYSVIPLFVIMAFFIIVSNLGADAYRGAFKWIGHWRGGLGYATVIGSAGLAAVEGTGSAAIITLGPVAVPEMRKFKYNEGMAAGIVAAGSTIGPMIPPSLGFVMFGILAETSIGQLFIAGVIPGLLLTALFMLTIWILCRIFPSYGPAGEKATWKERWKAVPLFGPIIALFILIIGGIYGGVFSAMEGGGIGAMVALLIALAFRRVTWKSFWKAITDAMLFISMLLLVVVGGMVFGNALGASGISKLLVSAIVGAGVTPLSFLGVIMFIYLLWGIICDAPIIVILTVPVLAPIARALGVDMIWFGVLTTAMVNLGSITPPYAMGIFMLRSILPDIPLTRMYKGILPFVGASVVFIILMMIFPKIVTWLPGLMMGR